MNKNYIRGRAAEYAVVRKLKEEGAILAQRTAGSHSPIDVIALMPNGHVRLIQVKKDSSPIQWDKLAALPTARNVMIELWHRKDGEWLIYR